MFLTTIVGFCSFYVLERFVHWHHHAATHDREPVTYLVLLSDTLHNFIDGLVIAGSFVVGVPVGVVTTHAIALQEIGDFDVLVYGGFDRRRALVLNYPTQATVILGGVVGDAFGEVFSAAPALLLSFAAGDFVSIASSDLIPEIEDEVSVRRSVAYFAVILSGIVSMLGIRLARGWFG